MIHLSVKRLLGLIFGLFNFISCDEHCRVQYDVCLTDGGQLCPPEVVVYNFHNGNYHALDAGVTSDSCNTGITRDFLLATAFEMSASIAGYVTVLQVDKDPAQLIFQSAVRCNMGTAAELQATVMTPGCQYNRVRSSTLRILSEQAVELVVTDRQLNPVGMGCAATDGC